MRLNVGLPFLLDPMKNVLRWVAIVGSVLLGLLVLAAGVVYVMSERAIDRTYPIPKVALTLPDDPAAIAEGRRLAVMRGCVNACHGKEGEGKVMFDNAAIARVVAPNLAAAARRYDASQLAGIIRDGVRPDGHSMLIMPSEAFIALDDADLSRIIAYLKTLPQTAGPDAVNRYGPLGRVGLATGQFKMVAQTIAESTPPPEAPGDAGGRGRYLARTICASCHGADLGGTSNPTFVAPDLSIVAGYTAVSFETLLRKGVAAGDRPLKVMPVVVRDELAVLTDQEISAMYGYLRGLPEARATSATAARK